MHPHRQDPCVRKFLQDFPCRFDAAQLRHRAVHHRHSGPQFANQTHGFLSVAGFSNNGNIRVIFQHAAKSAAYQRVIVRKQNPTPSSPFPPPLPSQSTNPPFPPPPAPPPRPPSP